MSNIVAIHDLNSKTWNVSTDIADPYKCVLNIGFSKGQQMPLIFDNLRFTVEIIENDELQEIRRFPPAGQYVNSAQQIVATTEFVIVPDQLYTIKIKTAHFEDTSDTLIEFTAPRPQCQYPSWSWVDGMWTPPVPMPEITGEIAPLWNEGTQSWG